MARGLSPQARLLQALMPAMAPLTRDEAAALDKAALAQAVESRLGDATICGRCNATLAEYATWCTARAEERCPGFAAVEAARKAVLAIWRDAIKGPRQ